MGLLVCWLKLQILILNPRNQARSASLGGGADSDAICKDIDAEDVGATTLRGRLAAMDSAPTPNATSPMQLWNQSILNPRNQARSASLGGGVDSDAICKDIDAEDIRATTLCSRLAVMDSAQLEMMLEKVIGLGEVRSIICLIINLLEMFKRLIGFDEMGGVTMQL